MRTNEIPHKPVSMWEPERNREALALLGKLVEECGELIGIAGRCTIQGVDAADPVTAEPNRLALQDEIADVFAMASLLVERLGLDTIAINDRVERKRDYKTPWFDWLRDGERP